MEPSELPRIDSRKIESFAIRVGELRLFVRELPDREVTVRFPYSNLTLPMQTVVDSFKPYGDDDYIFDQSQWHVISQAENLAHQAMRYERSFSRHTIKILSRELEWLTANNSHGYNC